MLSHFFSIILVVWSSHVCSAWVSILYPCVLMAEAKKSPSFCERNSRGRAPNRSEVTSHVISWCRVERKASPEEQAGAAAHVCSSSELVPPSQPALLHHRTHPCVPWLGAVLLNAQ